MTFNKTKVTKIFKKADMVYGENPNLIRIDRRGRIINRAAYGDQNSQYGWNIHHINGKSAGNEMHNLEPVHYDTHQELH